MCKELLTDDHIIIPRFINNYIYHNVNYELLVIFQGKCYVSIKNRIRARRRRQYTASLRNEVVLATPTPIELVNHENSYAILYLCLFRHLNLVLWMIETKKIIV